MRERDRSDYVAFTQARYGSMYRTSYLLTGDHHAAEDLLQVVLTKLYSAWPRVREVASPDAYARRALANEFLSLRRRRWTREVLSAHPADLAGAGWVSGPEEAVVETAMVWQALRKLTPKQRAVMVLRYYEELSEGEIATALDIAPGTVKGHAHAALAALSSSLPPRYAESSTEGERA